MQKDFHYYCIAVIAWAAGYSLEEIRTIAYASQYVDDNDLDAPILIEGRSDKYRPIRTAYKGIDYIRALTSAGQREILVPFHFIPKAPVETEKEALYQTAESSKFSHRVIDEALRVTGGHRLHRIGIALHAFADTWAHNGFSGVSDSKTNEVINLKTKEQYGGAFLGGIVNAVGVCIGHVGASSIPDFPFEAWECDGKSLRTNREVFASASEEIFKKLLNNRQIDAAEKQKRETDWEGRIIKEIEKAFDCNDQDTDRRCVRWKEAMNTLFDNGIVSLPREYNEWDWIHDALSVFSTGQKDIFSGRLSERQGAAEKSHQPEETWDVIRRGDMTLGPAIEWGIFKLKPDYEKTDWYLFQKAAREHRRLVMAKLPEQWTAQLDKNRDGQQ